MLLTLGVTQGKVLGVTYLRCYARQKSLKNADLNTKRLVYQLTIFYETQSSS